MRAIIIVNEIVFITSRGDSVFIIRPGQVLVLVVCLLGRITIQQLVFVAFGFKLSCVNRAMSYPVLFGI